MKDNYGYKVCYKEFGKQKLKIHMVCNSYDLAKWSIQYYENHQQIDKKSKKQIREPTWFILPIRSLLEYKRLWHGCPF